LVGEKRGKTEKGESHQGAADAINKEKVLKGENQGESAQPRGESKESRGSHKKFRGWKKRGRQEGAFRKGRGRTPSPREE